MYVHAAESHPSKLAHGGTGVHPIDVRNNYIQTGTTWAIGGAAPTSPFTGVISLGIEVGTSKLANSSMETYVQSINCFAGHRKDIFDPSVGMLGVSAIWKELEPLFTP